MWNKSKNSSKERIDFLLQDLWNNIFFKCVDANHTFIAKKFKEKMNGLMKERKERQP
jgi:hypothetical protein